MIPIFFADLKDSATTGYSYVIVQNIKVPISLNGSFHHAETIFRLGDISFEHRRFSTFFTDHRQGFFRALNHLVYHKNAGAFAGDGYLRCFAVANSRTA